jgi:acyl dehydratase
VSDQVKLREPIYEEVVIGEEIGPVEIVADEHYLRQACFAADDYTSWYLSKTPEFGVQLVPSMALVHDLLALFTIAYDPNLIVGLHQKEEVWFKKPVPFGARLRYTGRYIEKYQKRGKGYVVFESEAHDCTDNSLLVRQVSAEIMRVPDNVKLGEGSARTENTERVSAEWPSGVAEQDHATLDTKIGTPIRRLQKTVHQDQMSVFSGANKQWQNIHTQPQIAKQAGFPDTLAAGLMETCWMSEMLGNFFGPYWLSTGWMKNLYLKPVFRRDVVTCHGVVKERLEQADGVLLKLEVWVSNQSGTIVAAGWASGLVS